MRERDGWLLLTVAALGVGIVAAAVGVELGLSRGRSTESLLRSGASALLLGLLFSLCMPRAAAWRRLTFPLLSAVECLLAIRSAIWLGLRAEDVGLPFLAGPALAASAWAAIYLATAGWWLRRRQGAARLAAAFAAGLASFAAFVLLRELSAYAFAQILYVSVFWALWMFAVAVTFVAPALNAGRA